MVQLNLLLTSALLASATFVSAHPGHDVSEEALERREFFKRNPKTVRSCAGQMRARGIEAASLRRRQELAESLRAAQGLPSKGKLQRRDFSNYDFSHQSNDSSIGLETTYATLFSDNSSCTLQTEVTQGPYYVNGELIRKNLKESQTGVPLYIDIQIIDTSTCGPAASVYMDFWHCNATGVYSGVVANGNGDSSDESNLNATFLRGIQQSNSDGVVQFASIIPGHYTGRATHIHILTHANDSTVVAANNTLLGTSDSTLTHASHVGQLFFDQSLLSAVQAVSPYSSNTATVTENSEDQILSQEADTTDPFVEYAYLGDSISDGILAWVTIGINTDSDKEINAASTVYAIGAVSNGNVQGGDDGPGGQPLPINGTGPGSNASASGTPPTGIPTGYHNGSYATTFIASGGSTVTLPCSGNMTWSGVITPTTTVRASQTGGSSATSTVPTVTFATATGGAKAFGIRTSQSYALWSQGMFCLAFIFGLL